MNRSLMLVVLTLFATPLALAHDPPGPVVSCQPAAGESYHDYIPPTLGFLVIGGDGNLADCGPNNWTVGPWLNDNASICQILKSDPTLVAVWQALCQARDTGQSQTVGDYDGELDYGHGGVFLAVNSGDGSTWGSVACFGMQGHHSGRIYISRYAGDGGPAATATADHSRTPPAPGPKGPRADCGDNFVEPCDSTPPPPSTQPFPLNVVIDTINAQLWALFGPSGSGTTCNVNDCAQSTTSSASGHVHIMMGCPAGIDGTYVVFVSPDLDAPDFTQAGHVWTY